VSVSKGVSGSYGNIQNEWVDAKLRLA
jgi:hypothetical protein